MESSEQVQAETYPELVTDSELEEHDDEPVTTTSKDWIVSVLEAKYKKGKIDLQPEYQREYVWSQRPELPSRLIESLLLDIPIPPIYFAEMPDKRLEVIDGQQRLTTLMKFVNNEFVLRKLQRMSSLNGKNFKDLTDEQQDKIYDSSQIRSIVINTGQRPDLRYEVFERLNRGSVALTEQELRNSIYRGPFNNLLTQMEENYLWRKVKGSDEPEPRFKEREIILRFFSFADRMDHYKGNLKRFLNEYMGVHAPSDPLLLEEQATMFRQTMRNIYDVFGDRSARLYAADVESGSEMHGRWESKFSVSAFDIQSAALIGQDNEKVQKAAEQIREAYLFLLLTNPELRDAIGGQTSSADKTKTRWFSFKARVQDILGKTEVGPRFFSHEVRRELYDASPVCKTCGNEIHSFEDCAVDHVQPYSKGGKTELSNAQLAYRSCNARKWATLA
jgi:hypothetical protein